MRNWNFIIPNVLMFGYENPTTRFIILQVSPLLEDIMEKFNGIEIFLFTIYSQLSIFKVECRDLTESTFVSQLNWVRYHDTSW